MLHEYATFGARRGEPDVIWPQWTGPALEPRRFQRERELWERERELFFGDLVLEDEAASREDALLLLARYLTVRIASYAECGERSGFAAEIERAAALEYLDALPRVLPEQRWLRAVLTSIGPRGMPTRGTVSRLAAAAGAAAKRGARRGAFALSRVAYRIAAGQGWHRQAGRIARTLAREANRADARRSVKLWSRRARVHERRTAE